MSANRKLISADRLFDGDGRVLADSGVIIEGDRILAVGRREALRQEFGAGPLDFHHYDGATLLPGLIDAHTHLAMPGTGEGIIEWSQTADATLLLVMARNGWLSLKAGVTTLADLGCKGDLAFRLRDAAATGVVRSSRLLLCGRALTITGGHGWPWQGEADGVDGVRLAVRQLCKEGADFIKVMVTGGGTPGTDGRRPSYTLAELQAIVDEAHTRNRRVFGHCTAARGIELALDAGFDLIAHCQFLAPDGAMRYDESLARRIADQGVFVNPTLQINRILMTDRVSRATMPPARRAQLDAWNQYYPQMVESFLRMAELGVRMVCGSDCGWGYSTFDETYLELDAMVAAGLSPVQALVTATGNAADALAQSGEIGRLQPGHKADLLLVDGDPATEIIALRNVRDVWLDGQQTFTQDPSMSGPRPLLWL